MFVSWRARPMSEPARGAQIVRIGQADNPAHLIVRGNDAAVLKRRRELFRG